MHREAAVEETPQQMLQNNLDVLHKEPKGTPVVTSCLALQVLFCWRGACDTSRCIMQRLVDACSVVSKQYAKGVSVKVATLQPVVQAIRHVDCSDGAR